MDFIENNDQATIKNINVLRNFASLLQLDHSETEKALCSRVVAARGEVIEKSHSVEQAIYGRDALAKVQ